MTGNRTQRGFSLVEVLISIALLAVALLGVMGSIAYGTRHSGSGAELSEAVHLARTVLVHIQEAGLVDTTELDEAWPTTDSGLNDEIDMRRPIDEAPFGGLEFTLPQLQRYQRRIVSERSSEEPLDHRYRLATVTVHLYWQSPQGERTVHLTGLVSHARP